MHRHMFSKVSLIVLDTVHHNEEPERWLPLSLSHCRRRDWSRDSNDSSRVIPALNPGPETPGCRARRCQRPRRQLFLPPLPLPLLFHASDKRPFCSPLPSPPLFLPPSTLGTKATRDPHQRCGRGKSHRPTEIKHLEANPRANNDDPAATHRADLRLYPPRPQCPPPTQQGGGSGEEPRSASMYMDEVGLHLGRGSE